MNTSITALLYSLFCKKPTINISNNKQQQEQFKTMQKSLLNTDLYEQSKTHSPNKNMKNKAGNPCIKPNNNRNKNNRNCYVTTHFKYFNSLPRILI